VTEGSGPSRQSRPTQSATWAIVALLVFSALALTLAAIRGGMGSSATTSSEGTVVAPGGRPAAQTQPPGGITAELAIDIASGQRGLRGADGFSASAVAMLDPASQRWVWHVTWRLAGGPTSSEGCDDVTVDYLTGEVLSRSCWVS
jgi:hypothetical protein